MVKVEGTLDEIRELFREKMGPPKKVNRPKSTTKKETKVKRKASAYQKEVGRQLKKLKKKHPRTAVPKLMKRAHAAAKRVRKKK